VLFRSADIRFLRECGHRYPAEERRRLVEQLNRRIAAYNLKVPVALAQKLPVELDS
jgi:hypothetical protein